MADMYVDDVVEETGISKRNVKYWCKKYDLPVEKDGRSNVYPPQTVKLLRLVDLLSDTDLFNHRFIQMQVDRGLGKSAEELEFIEEYEKVRTQGAAVLSELPSSGSVILPPLSGTNSVSEPRNKAGKEASEIDEILL